MFLLSSANKCKKCTMAPDDFVLTGWKKLWFYFWNLFPYLRNVLLVNSSADHLKVGDFGLSKLIKVQNSHDVYKMTGETGSCKFPLKVTVELHKTIATDGIFFCFALEQL